MSTVDDDDFSDLDDLDDDEFADLAEFDEEQPAFDYTPVDLNALPDPEPVAAPVKKGSAKRKEGAPREPLWSGWCSFPETDQPQNSHQRCADRGAGSSAVPDKVFSPCPCPCHLEEVGDCTGCGEMLYLAAHYPEDPAYPGEPIYVHLTVDYRGKAQAGSEFCK